MSKPNQTPLEPTFMFEIDQLSVYGKKFSTVIVMLQFKLTKI